MSFTPKKIELAFQLNDGKTFTGTSSNVVTLSGLRVSATVVKSGGVGMTVAQLRVFGMAPSLMQQLSTYGAPIDFATQATVQVSAGDDESGMSIVSVGNITSAVADFEQAPEVSFTIAAHTGLIDAIKPAKPTSINGGADAAKIMSQLAGTMGYSFENNGVSVQLSCPYFAGTARMQAQECAEAGDFNWIIDGGTLAIWPKSGVRKAKLVVVSPQTGMVGFPKFMNQGVVVKTLYNPDIQFGSLIRVESSLQNACGLWGVTNMLYDLASETPGGDWFMTIQALSPNFVENVNAS